MRKTTDAAAQDDVRRRTGIPGPAADAPRGGRTLAELARAAGADPPPPAAAGVEIRGIAEDSRAVRPGDLFVALPGTRTDGHEFAREAAERGAAAIVAEEPVPTGLEIPCLRVDDARRALARMAAAWHGRPAERLRLAGITGTVGKTSVLAIMEAALRRSAVPVGAIGSLGVSVQGEQRPTGYTAPDPLLLHEGLARIADGGARLAVMEVTSHALVQERVHGLEFALGVFTNLVPLEHADYHSSFRSYVEAKTRFFDHLAPGAPIVYSWDDLAVRRVVRGRDLVLVGCGFGREAAVRVEGIEIGPAGTRFRINVRRPLPRLDAGPIKPFAVDVRLRLLGRANALNATLAATAALCLGAAPEAVVAELEGLPSPRRRMQIVHDGAFRVLDDTVGHPDSVTALFEVVAALPARRVHAAFAVRGQRGPRINRQVARALGIWTESHPLETLVVTRSDDTADARNRVTDREHDAFVGALRDAGVAFEERATLAEAVPAVLERAGPGDLVLLLGAQGMDAGEEIARGWLEAHGAA
jgi:UDP-N-acetylmuramoyl-L-alanyl-D-glutamate--2,6-diaminopimelate ligase